MVAIIGATLAVTRKYTSLCLVSRNFSTWESIFSSYSEIASTDLEAGISRERNGRKWTRIAWLDASALSVGSAIENGKARALWPRNKA
jgi:hypothetical protein